jgi:hypothetical protein
MNYLTSAELDELADYIRLLNDGGASSQLTLEAKVIDASREQVGVIQHCEAADGYVFFLLRTE